MNKGKEITGVSINSKAIRSGNLFIPIVRLKNGHDYVEEAIEQGAIASLWEKSRPNPPCSLSMILCIFLYISILARF
ncbi:Mur ligase domain-containing protein [Bacillus sp. LK2]|uniref:Mur ligase domain-containing protein n=1 Tax=Bacillus sp. LK2 TaxID=1628206 RepID=UPI000654A994|nr:hypothetical protein VK90_24210 [Bacillus sp. LK2]